MKISKKRWGDLTWVTVFAIILFTPLGMTVKIEINKLIAFCPDVSDQNDAIRLDTFNWQLQDLKSGKVMNLIDLKGEVIFINTWATWCPPCLAEMSDINALYKDYKDKINFVMVSNDREALITNYMTERTYTFKNYMPISNAPEALSSKSIPHTVIIDKSGYIRVDKVGSAKWNHEDLRAELDKMIME